MINIKVTPGELRALAQTLTSTREEVLSLITNMDSQIQQVTAGWEGFSSSQYLQNYDELLPKLKDDFPQVIEALSTRLNYVADTIEQADADAASAIKMF